MKMKQINLLAWGDKLGKLTVCTSFYFTENQTCHSPPFRSEKNREKITIGNRKMFTNLTVKYDLDLFVLQLSYSCIMMQWRWK